MKRIYSTYIGWKRAIKKEFTMNVITGDHALSLKFDGNKDICCALIVWPDNHTTGLGEWDGEKGEIY